LHFSLRNVRKILTVNGGKIYGATVAALAESFGRGALTNHWNDFQNSDVILIMRIDPASNHPISFKWITKAMEKGGKAHLCRSPVHAVGGEGPSLRPDPVGNGYRVPLREAGIFSMPEDLEWMMCAGGYLWHVDKVPEVGKYNPGQKMFF
jgi:hypothetical protein